MSDLPARWSIGGAARGNTDATTKYCCLVCLQLRARMIKRVEPHPVMLTISLREASRFTRDVNDPMHAGSSRKLFFETSKLSSVCSEATRAGTVLMEIDDSESTTSEPPSYASILDSASSLIVQAAHVCEMRLSNFHSSATPRITSTSATPVCRDCMRPFNFIMQEAVLCDSYACDPDTATGGLCCKTHACGGMVPAESDR